MCLFASTYLSFYNFFGTIYKSHYTFDIIYESHCTIQLTFNLFIFFTLSIKDFQFQLSKLFPNRAQ